MQFSKMNGNIENFLKIPKDLNVVKRDLKAQLVVACFISALSVSVQKNEIFKI